MEKFVRCVGCGEFAPCDEAAPPASGWWILIGDQSEHALCGQCVRASSAGWSEWEEAEPQHTPEAPSVASNGFRWYSNTTHPKMPAGRWLHFWDGTLVSEGDRDDAPPEGQFWWRCAGPAA